MNLQGCLLKVLPGKEGLMVFEISECAKMKIYKLLLSDKQFDNP